MRNIKFFGFILILLSYSISFGVTEEEARKALKKEEQPQEVLTQFERDYILLPKGTFEVDTDLSYVYYSANQIFLESFAILDPVFLTLGKFDIERFRRHIFTYALTFRYGLTGNIEANVAVPIIYRFERKSITNKPDETNNVLGLGDITVSLSYQPIRETYKRPAVVTFIALKTKTGKSPYDLEDPKKDLPTGSGYYSIRVGFNLTKTIDPVVVFGGISYAYNAEVKVEKLIEGKFLEKVYPGDNIGLNIGLAYALTYNFAINYQLIQNYTLTTKTKINGVLQDAPNSTLNSTVFRIGFGWIFSPKFSVNVGISVGLTSDAPDYSFELRFTYKI